MSKYDKASLVQIPSAYNANSSPNPLLYSVLPENGNGDFTFDRNAGTATRVNKDGLIESVAADVPRLDYPLIDGVVQDCPVLLLEPQSLNQIINSENLSNGSWGKTNAVVESNSTISPDGTLSADKLTFNTSGSFGRIFSSTLTSVNSVSFFIKYIDLEYILIFVDTSSNGVYVNIKEGYATSSVLGAGLDVTFKKFPNDWLRIEAKGGNNATRLEIYAANSTPAYNPITTNGSFYLWGCQAETNSYPTSYIPTSDLTVTRNADVCDSAGTSAEFNDSEGVLYAEISALADDGVNKYIAISDGSISNRVNIFYDTSNNLRAFITGLSGTISYGADTSENSKIALKYKSGDIALWYNGFEVKTSTSSISASGLDTFNFDNGGGGSDMYCKTKEVAVFKEALTDSELEALTSWDSFKEMAKSQEYSLH